MITVIIDFFFYTQNKNILIGLPYFPFSIEPINSLNAPLIN